jgi:histone acetyltransferase (RNA polymerase elongator complex component)
MPGQVEDAVRTFFSHCREPLNRRRLLAFYGGSFTGIAEKILEDYLAVARKLICQGLIHGVKASIRPDQIDAGMMDRLLNAGFVELEVGAQSLDDSVLAACRRGHTARDTIHAARLIKEAGLSLGIQYMPGLPGEDRPSFLSSVDGILAIEPDTARIYPTVVLAGTALEKRYISGDYAPLTLDEAISRTLYAAVRLEERGIRIVRMGLPQADSLKVVAGPYHPCFGFLVRARGYFHMAAAVREMIGPEATLRVHPRDVSALLGHGRENLRRLSFDYCTDGSAPRGAISVNFSTNNTCVRLLDVIEHFL